MIRTVGGNCGWMTYYCSRYAALSALSQSRHSLVLIAHRSTSNMCFAAAKVAIGLTSPLTGCVKFEMAEADGRLPRSPGSAPSCASASSSSQSGSSNSGGASLLCQSAFNHVVSSVRQALQEAVTGSYSAPGDATVAAADKSVDQLLEEIEGPGASNAAATATASSGKRSTGGKGRKGRDKRREKSSVNVSRGVSKEPSSSVAVGTGEMTQPVTADEISLPSPSGSTAAQQAASALASSSTAASIPDVSSTPPPAPQRGPSRKQLLQEVTGIQITLSETDREISRLEQQLVEREQKHTIDLQVARLESFQRSGRVLADLRSAKSQRSALEKRIAEIEQRRPQLAQQLAAAEDAVQSLLCHGAVPSSSPTSVTGPRTSAAGSRICSDAPLSLRSSNVSRASSLLRSRLAAARRASANAAASLRSQMAAVRHGTEAEAAMLRAKIEQAQSAVQELQARREGEIQRVSEQANAYALQLQQQVQLALDAREAVLQQRRGEIAALTAHAATPVASVASTAAVDDEVLRLRTAVAEQHAMIAAAEAHAMIALTYSAYNNCGHAAENTSAEVAIDSSPLAFGGSFSSAHPSASPSASSFAVSHRSEPPVENQLLFYGRLQQQQHYGGLLPSSYDNYVTAASSEAYADSAGMGNENASAAAGHTVYAEGSDDGAAFSDLYGAIEDPWASQLGGSQAPTSHDGPPTANGGDSSSYDVGNDYSHSHPYGDESNRHPAEGYDQHPAEGYGQHPAEGYGQHPPGGYEQQQQEYEQQYQHSHQQRPPPDGYPDGLGPERGYPN